MNQRKGVLVAMKPGVSTMYSLGKPLTLNPKPFILTLKP